MRHRTIPTLPAFIGLALLPLCAVRTVRAQASPVWTHADGGQGWVGRTVSLGNGGNEVFCELADAQHAALLLSSNDVDPPTPLWSHALPSGPTDQQVASAETTGIHVSLHTLDQGLPSAQTVLAKYTTLSNGVPDWTYAFGTATDGGTDCAISRSGQVIVAGITLHASAAVELAVFDPGSNVPLSTTIVPIIAGHALRGFDLSADGSTLFLRVNATGYVFDVASRSVVFSLFLGGVFDCQAISGDGRRLAFGRINNLRVYDKLGNSYVNTFNHINSGFFYVERVELSDDGDTVACAWTDFDQYQTFIVQAFDVPSQAQTMLDEVTGSGSLPNVVSSLALSADGRRIAVGVLGDEAQSVAELRLYSSTQDQPLATWNMPGSVLDVALSADGKRLAAASHATHASLPGGGGSIALFADAPDFTALCFGDGLDPSVSTDCACLNFGAPGHGCANSVHASGARLFAAGLTQPDTLQLTLVHVPPFVGTIYLQGSALLSAGAAFGDGVRCAGGQLVRLGLKIDAEGDGITSFGPATGDAQVSVAGSVSGGSTYVYQGYYRNPDALWCPPGTFNISQAFEIAW